MRTGQPIVAYWLKGEWYSADDVQKARVSDRAAFWDAHPYTLSALRNRRDYGRDVPEWIKLDELESSDST
jgi:hypothetical protein